MPMIIIASHGNCVCVLYLLFFRPTLTVRNSDHLTFEIGSRSLVSAHKQETYYILKRNISTSENFLNYIIGTKIDYYAVTYVEWNNNFFNEFIEIRIE